MVKEPRLKSNRILLKQRFSEVRYLATSIITIDSIVIVIATHLLFTTYYLLVIIRGQSQGMYGIAGRWLGWLGPSQTE